MHTNCPFIICYLKNTTANLNTAGCEQCEQQEHKIQMIIVEVKKVCVYAGAQNTQRHSRTTSHFLVKQAVEAVVISHCMLNSRNSTEAGVGNNLSSQSGGEAQAGNM